MSKNCSSAFHRSCSVPYPDKGQIIFRDDRFPGFGLRVTPGSKTYVVEARVQGVARRITLGKVGIVTPATARKKARRMQAMMAAGKDPMLEKARKQIAGVTLQEVLDRYLSVRNLRPNTIRTYRYILPRCMADWLDLPVVASTREILNKGISSFVGRQSKAPPVKLRQIQLCASLTRY